METKKALAEGICERIGIDGVSTYKVPAMGLKETKELPLENHEEAIKLVISLLYLKELLQNSLNILAIKTIKKCTSDLLTPNRTLEITILKLVNSENKIKKNNGFTIIETMIAISVFLVV
jgi:prepilin-type N-terminal cleavage/methylation domain-containing protein